LVEGEPFVRFYAGSPLVTKEGYALGTLCVIDQKPSRLTVDQREGLTALARQVVRLFELRKHANSIVSDLALSRSAEFETKRLSMQLGAAQEVAKIGSWEFNLSTHEQWWSHEHYKIFEIQAPQTPDVLFQMYRDKIHPEDLPRLNICLDEAQNMGTGFTFDHRVFLDGGSRIKYVRGICRVVKNARGETILQGTCQDRSEEVRLAKALENERVKALQAAKLASLGEMAAGVAHEINNPLAIITGAIELMKRELGRPEAVEKRLGTVKDSVQRIAKIVGGLKKFSRSSERCERLPRSLKVLISEVLFLTASKSKRFDVQVDFQMAEDLQIVCNENEIQQVLINIINNGIDAVKELDKRWVAVEVIENPDEVIIKIQDSGRGISPDIAEKMFDPFFTTKEVGEGTGLGLAISKGIVEDHGGSIRLEGSGVHTCFAIILPKRGDVKNAA
jgi:signal transduction histidine kinase